MPSTTCADARLSSLYRLHRLPSCDASRITESPLTAPLRYVRRCHIWLSAKLNYAISLLIASIILFIAVPTAWANPPAGEVLCAHTRGFHDGDTFACIRSAQHGSTTVVVRVAGIDAPETGQLFWRTARSHLRSLAIPGTAISCYKLDRYSRNVCRVHAPDGRDIALEMVRSGLAWHAKAYAHEQTPQQRHAYAAAESVARKKGVGLWAESNPQPPSECRKLKRQSQRCR